MTTKLLHYENVGKTHFDDGTDQKVIEILERARYEGMRLTFTFGDPETGVAWDEKHYVSGYIGRSMGDKKVPLLLATKISISGGVILTKNILQIRLSNKKNIDYVTCSNVLYVHPKLIE
jgi:hypothetical protein